MFDGLSGTCSCLSHAAAGPVFAYNSISSVKMVWYILVLVVLFGQSRALKPRRKHVRQPQIILMISRDKKPQKLLIHVNKWAKSVLLSLNKRPPSCFSLKTYNMYSTDLRDVEFPSNKQDQSIIVLNKHIGVSSLLVLQYYYSPHSHCMCLCVVFCSGCVGGVYV